MVEDTAVVVGIPGCTGWSEGEWALAPELRKLCTRRDVYLLFDADAAENRMVYDAADALRKSIGPAAKSVKFMQCPGGGKEGIDDYLATLDADDRADIIRTLMDDALNKPAPRRPTKRKVAPDPAVTDAKRKEAAAQVMSDLADEPELDEAALPAIGGEIGDGSMWMDPETGAFLPETLARAIITSGTPVAAVAQKDGSDGVPAVYQRGYYRADAVTFTSATRRFLGDSFSLSRRSVVEQECLSLCSEYGRTLPDHPSEPFVSLRNGMLDLRTLELHPHDPSYRSLRQFPVSWNPDATCPRYEDELVERIGEHQLGVLEEVVSQFLDESQTPSKGVLLFGPNRSGKSTFLRLLVAMVGGDSRVSAVSLHQLVDGGFGVAELFGKALNICADLPSSHIADLSVYKRMTGGDPITGSKKYGPMIHFKSNALFAMSTNELPTVPVAEAPSYFSRVVPVGFVRSFIGEENPAVESTLLTELEGILVRWVKARHAHMQRDYRWIAPPAAVTAHFQAESDRVVRFLRTCCVVGTRPAVKHPSTGIADPSRKWIGDGVTAETKSALHAAFMEYASQEKAGHMTLSTFSRRLDVTPGVSLNCYNSDGKRVTNVAVKPSDEWEASSGYEHLLSKLFSDVTTSPSVPEAGTTTEPDRVPEPEPTEPEPAEPTSTKPPSTIPTDDPMSLFTSAFAKLVCERAVAHPSVDPHQVVCSAPASVLLTELAATQPQAPERLRALIRRLDKQLYTSGIILRERRMTTPGDLSSVCPPQFGDSDFGTERVAYSVVRFTVKRPEEN
jgi:putative DNA primase/helicase